MRYKNSGKTARGIIVGLISKMNKDIALNCNVIYKPLEIKLILEEALRRYDEVQTRAKVNITAWRGKSGLRVIVHPDIFEVIRYRKQDQDSEPKEVINEIPKEEVNLFLAAISRLNKKQKIKTREIAEEYCKIRRLKINGHGTYLFTDSGEFLWDECFADRSLHTLINDVLGLLDYYKIIKYRGGKSEVLSNILNIQTILTTK